MAHPERIFRRCVEDNKNWWHWREDCNIWLAAAGQKKRGLTFVYEESTDGSRPTTYSLCPGCAALDARIATKQHPYLTKRVVPVAKVTSPPVNPVNFVASVGPNTSLPTSRYYPANTSGE
jgi:hypothetical protein